MIITPEIYVASNWYLVYTKPKQENIAYLNLQQQGFQAYLPLYKNLKNTLASGLIGFEPMFPRYVFFRPGPPHPVDLIRPLHTRGFHHYELWV